MSYAALAEGLGKYECYINEVIFVEVLPKPVNVIMLIKKKNQTKRGKLTRNGNQSKIL